MLPQQPPPIDRPSGTPIENPPYSLPHYGGPTPPLQQPGLQAQPSPVPQVAESLVVHGSTPLSQIGLVLKMSSLKNGHNQLDYRGSLVSASHRSSFR